MGRLSLLCHVHVPRIHSHPSPVVTITDSINRSEVILSELIVKLSVMCVCVCALAILFNLKISSILYIIHFPILINVISKLNIINCLTTKSTLIHVLLTLLNIIASATKWILTRT